MRVLVTGFGPFLTHAENPSAELARALDGRTAGGVELVAEAPLPVVFGEAAAIAIASAKRHGARGIVSLGLAGSATKLRVEARARNRATSADPDARGVSMEGRDLVPGGDDVLSTPVDVAAFVRALAERGVAANLSEDAGGYVCNDLYYRVLSATSSGELDARALFVHVPPVFEPDLASALLHAIGAAFATR